MRILVATGIYPPQIGGPATYSKLLYDELPKRGFQVDIVNFGDFISKPKIIRHILFFIELLKKGQGVDVVYAQDPVSVGLPALIASQILQKKFVLKIVGDYAWEQGVQRFGVEDTLDVFSTKYQKYSPQVRTLKKIQKYVADGAHAIVTPSSYLKGIVANWGVKESKIRVIYNGFHSQDLKGTKTNIRKKYKLHGTILMSVGRLVPWKGFSTLIDVFVSVKKEIPDAMLFIAGDGPLKDELALKVSSQGLGDSVVFLGRLDQQVLFEYIKASDIFVLNTQYEGFSHQILETMSLGVPIITTRVGGNSEIIENDHTGVLVSYNDAGALSEHIFRLVRNPSLSQSLVRKARERVKGFTDERMLNEFAQFISTL
jgi:glycosyltransferase involved in cell wall biosynthesis